MELFMQHNVEKHFTMRSICNTRPSETAALEFSLCFNGVCVGILEWWYPNEILAPIWVCCCCGESRLSTIARSRSLVQSVKMHFPCEPCLSFSSFCSCLLLRPVSLRQFPLRLRNKFDSLLHSRANNPHSQGNQRKFSRSTRK